MNRLIRDEASHTVALGTQWNLVIGIRPDSGSSTGIEVSDIFPHIYYMTDLNPIILYTMSRETDIDLAEFHFTWMQTGAE